MSRGRSDPLRVIVTVKQVLDPEAPPSLMQVDPETFEVSGRGVAPRLDPYSMNALQAALDLRERCAPDRTVEIHVVGIGPSPSRNLYLRALACGADRVSLLDTSRDPVPFGDAWGTADRLVGLIGHVNSQSWDLLLVGRRAADTNSAAVGPAMAHRLGVPVVTMATAVRLGDTEAGCDRVVVEQLSDSGSNVLTAPLPVVVCVSHEVGEPPAVPFSNMVAAKKMPLEILTPGDLGGNDGTEAISCVSLLRGMHQRDDHRSCQLVEGSDGRNAGRELARRIGEVIRT